MKRFAKRFLLLVSPLLATSALLTSPSQAATFSSSQGALDLFDFTENFSTTESQNLGNVSAVANGGIVNAQNIKAVANITPNPLEVFTSATSVANGDSKDYFGTADATAKIIGNFNVDPGKVFSFNFASALDLETQIDNPPAENASASGKLSFFLLDTTNVPQNNLQNFLADLLSSPSNSIPNNALDFFSLSGNLNTQGGGDFITSQKSQNVTFTTEDKDFSFGGTQEFATDFIEGSLQRSFDRKANLTLVAVRSTQSRVVAPEPSLNFALVLFIGSLVFAAKHRRRGHIKVGGELLEESYGHKIIE
ncbi:hypothetical protein G7B40_022320 [Aetokthonos hydrillicola Thurmond2011]|jgi:hypothetical protein|uniref:PEP-CTERM sorting domain-containing protein n=1 Tax=Aetokthonos hydrillicola Thurmond2011 TaxID=2712845 RepID=A0AAP5IBM5_9CYAN|nr:hypothetical protein [Aetokthonos hydrillicola]MBO3460779.1 hypothetical protein [Aetokthonos hydrillicola CCALA 1050]MBW4585376.1 hypothetical protein [Aetokthonos hydrillicola CCALA 1050]MDR9897279.1 hypothetical protein [Aetokthonos hydrillicola Thurmond2011]